MMNMEWSILPGYAREEEIRELFTEYTNMVLAGDPAFAGYLARQHYEDELAHPARKYAPPHGRLYLVCTGSTPVGWWWCRYGSIACADYAHDQDFAHY